MTAGVLRAAYVERFLAGDGIRQRLKNLLRASEGRTHWPASLDELRFSFTVRTDAQRQADEQLVTGCDNIAAELRLPELAPRVYDWLRDSRFMSAADAIRYAPSALGAFTGVAAEVGDVEVRRTERVLPDGRRIVEVDRRPLVRVQLADQWDPSREARADAEKRLVRLASEAIHEELDRIETHAEAIGYALPDTRPNVRRDIEWLVWRVRDGLSYGTIADQQVGKEPIGEDAIRLAVRAMAKRIGVVLRRRKFRVGP